MQGVNLSYFWLSFYLGQSHLKTPVLNENDLLPKFSENSPSCSLLLFTRFPLFHPPTEVVTVKISEIFLKNAIKCEKYLFLHSLTKYSTLLNVNQFTH